MLLIKLKKLDYSVRTIQIILEENDKRKDDITLTPAKCTFPAQFIKRYYLILEIGYYRKITLNDNLVLFERFITK